MTCVLSAKGLHKAYGATQALRDASMQVGQAEVLAIMGPSGSGKSTLLHCLAGIVTPDSGEVIFNSTRIDGLSDDKRSVLRRSSFGFVFQFGQLVPELNALDNVALPLMLNGQCKKTAQHHAAAWLEKVGLAEKSDGLPGQLSGGEAQRVAIARAMAIEPKVLFADEPTGALDSLSSQTVLELMVRVAKENNTSVVIVTHEPSVAAYADREVFVRDGRVADLNFHTSADANVTNADGAHCASHGSTTDSTIETAR